MCVVFLYFIANPPFPNWIFELIGLFSAFAVIPVNSTGGRCFFTALSVPGRKAALLVAQCVQLLPCQPTALGLRRK